MNKELEKYVNNFGNEVISNKHLYYINGLISRNNFGGNGYLYKLVGYIYNVIMSQKNTDSEKKTLEEVVNDFNIKNKNI